MANGYTLQSCEKLIDKYVNEFNGEVTEVREGVLGLGTLVLHSAKGKKTIIINEVYVSAWASTHTIRMYNKIPKKYQAMIDKVA